MKKALIIVNTGTPDDAGVKSVKKYLSEFLNDPYVIDLPWILRKILVNLIIVPFRARHSTELYEKLPFIAGDFPLKVNMEKLVMKLQQKLESEYLVTGAMRYGNPSLKAALENIGKEGCEEITIFPLFPQYASSTTGSVKQLTVEGTAKWDKAHQIRFVDQFYSHPAFIRAFASVIKNHRPENFDHVLFSYHGLPVRYVQKIHPHQDPGTCTCKEKMTEYGKSCYKAECYETTRLIAEKLNLEKERYSTSFQSRMSERWITPYTDQVLKELTETRKTKILVAAPSFTSDCLETIVEIGEGYRHISDGIELVESLNYNDEWVEAIVQIIN